MSANSNTVISLKSAFLRTQTRILSQPLQAPERWRAGNLDASDIPENVIKDVIREVNRLLRRHTKSAYPSLAIRHVAEQIDALYWSAGAPTLSITHNDDPSFSSFHPNQQTTTPLDPLRPSADLTAPSTIAALPPTWAEATAEAAVSSSADADEAARYEKLVARLQELDERRRAACRRLERCREVRERVGALAAPRENVQANLVTRDGELSRGVAEAKTLGVRVGARVGAWAKGLEGVDGEGVVVVGDGGRSREAEREKLRGLLEG